MSKEANVVNYYVICNRLKDTIRTGWNDWNVNRKRIESVAEHVYGTQMLAIGIAFEYKYDLDIQKVIFMIAVHELGEAVIGDLTHFQISKEEKEKKEHEAVHNILGNLLGGEKIEELFLEFDEGKTPEAKFAYQCDKLECNIQCKLYDEENCVDLNNQEGNSTANEKLVKELLDNGKSWSEMWIEYWEQKCAFDKNFFAINEYVKNNKISEN